MIKEDNRTYAFLVYCQYRGKEKVYRKYVKDSVTGQSLNSESLAGDPNRASGVGQMMVKGKFDHPSQAEAPTFLAYEWIMRG